MKKEGFILLGVLILCSCGQREGLAPVVESRWKAVNNHEIQHEVAPGETLYAIAFRYDQDYRQLAQLNHLRSPYTLRVGQMVRLRPSNTTPQAPVVASYVPTPKYIKRTQPIASIAKKAPLKRQAAGWSWPIHGRVAARYAPQLGNKGINIAGKKGEFIHAANGGVVAYAGNGLSGYGNLIIIRHDNQFLTAYGNNSRNLVKEGQQIQSGQKIAEIGIVDRRYWGLHFEIRRAGLPVNPLDYLQNG